MKIIITFDENDNQFVDFEIDGKTKRVKKIPFGIEGDVNNEESLGDFMFSALFPTAETLLKLRDIQLSNTWDEVLSDDALQDMWEAVGY